MHVVTCVFGLWLTAERADQEKGPGGMGPVEIVYVGGGKGSPLTGRRAQGMIIFLLTVLYQSLSTILIVIDI